MGERRRNKARGKHLSMSEMLVVPITDWKSCLSTVLDVQLRLVSLRKYFRMSRNDSGIQ